MYQTNNKIYAEIICTELCRMHIAEKKQVQKIRAENYAEQKKHED